MSRYHPATKPTRTGQFDPLGGSGPARQPLVCFTVVALADLAGFQSGGPPPSFHEQRAG